MKNFCACGEDGNLPKPQQYLYNVGVCLSQLGHTVLGGDPDESISGATGKASIQGKPFFKHFMEPFINSLFRDPEHCQNAMEFDEGKRAIFPWYNHDYFEGLTHEEIETLCSTKKKR